MEPYSCIILHERRPIKVIPPVNLLLLSPHILQSLLLFNVQLSNQLINPTYGFFPLLLPIVTIIHPRIIVIHRHIIHLLLLSTIVTLFYIQHSIIVETLIDFVILQLHFVNILPYLTHSSSKSLIHLSISLIIGLNVDVDLF